MKTIIIKVKPSRPEREGIRKAAKAIREGKLVVFPTETVYGIGANALDGRACAKIFRVKGRNRDNPLIVHVNSIKMAESLAGIPNRYKKTIRGIWPAPITFVVKARKILPRTVTSGLGTVAIRMPRDRVALALIKESGVPIAAPSANISEKPSATSARHAIKYFNGKVDVIIDSGRTRFGIESTILDLRNFALLRPGAFTVEDIRRHFGRRPILNKSAFGLKEAKKIVSPGMRHRHYSPDTPLFLFEGTDIKGLRDALKKYRGRFAFIGSEESCNMLGKMLGHRIVLGKRNDLAEIARNLFDALIRLDSLDVDFGVIESFPAKKEGLAIMNRLRKASQHRSFRNGSQVNRLVMSYHR